MREGTERLLKPGQRHCRDQRAVNKRINSIGGVRGAVSNRRNSAVGAREAVKNRSNNSGISRNRARGVRDAGATVFEGPGRLLATRATVLEG